ncbi:peptide transport system ATP-binding protein sapF [Klebsiella aerogenes]|nr:peptide transport system ATP-binding protein sapF [Klebsiella aerogenes]
MVETLLEVRQLSKTFATAPAGFTARRWRPSKPLSFTLRERQTLAIIGENGSGNPPSPRCWRAWWNPPAASC